MERVFVYKNLHKQCYSVRDEKSRRVFMHQEYVVVAKAELVVRPGGRERVLREKRKNVHAGVRGLLLFSGDKALEFRKQFTETPWVQIRYNPYENSRFVRNDTNRWVFHSALVYLEPKGAWILP